MCVLRDGGSVKCYIYSRDCEFSYGDRKLPPCMVSFHSPRQLQIQIPILSADQWYFSKGIEGEQKKMLF